MTETSNDRKPRTYKLKPKTLEHLDALAKSMDCSRGRVIEHAIEQLFMARGEKDD